jgi:hypothetical protein
LKVEAMPPSFAERSAARPDLECRDEESGMRVEGSGLRVQSVICSAPTVVR